MSEDNSDKQEQDPEIDEGADSADELESSQELQQEQEPEQRPEPEAEDEKGSDECPPCKAGSPAWMATFADMATLLMAFFVLILSFAHVNVPKYKEVSGSMRSRFGVQITVPVVEAPTADNVVATQYRRMQTDPTAADVLEEQRSREEQSQDEPDRDDGIGESTTNAKEMVENQLASEIAEGRVAVSVVDGRIVIETLERNTLESSPGKISQETILLLAKVSEVQADAEALIQVEGAEFTSASQSEIDDDFRASPSQQSRDQLEQIRMNLSSEIEQGLAEVFRDGDSIVIRLTDQGGFGSGSASLNPEFTVLLDTVGQTLSSTSGLVQIEGHTDNVAMSFGTRFRDNWDLSSARAASVADYLQEQGSVTPGSMVVKGFADTKPIAENTSALGRSQNRRIEIVVVPN